MDPESGTGPAKEQPTPTPPPEGWRRRPSGALWPDHHHTLYPGDLTARRKAKFRPRLEQDPALATAKDALLAQYGPALDHYRTVHLTGSWDEETERAYDRTVWELIQAIEARSRPTEGTERADHHMRSYFLAEQVFTALEFPPEGIDAASGEFEPILLVANAGEAPLGMKIYPGEIAMKFTQASQTDREAHNGLIRSAQRSFGYPPNEGGRPRRDQKEEPSLLALTAAKLYHWRQWKFETIDAFLELPRQGDTQGTEAAQQRGRRYVQTGEAELARRYGPTWRTPPPAFDTLWEGEEG